MFSFSNRFVFLPVCFCLFGIAEASDWQRVFFDDFDASGLDRTVWATRYIYSNEKLDHLKDEAQRYRDNNNHVIADGVLSLVARYNGDGVFESGMIRSKKTFMYGYFEARVFLPNAKGVWPAFWLNSDYDENGKLEWPPEIDVFEFALNVKDDKDNMLHSAVVEKGQPKEPYFYYSSPDFNLKHKNLIASSALNTEWHVAGLLWDSDSVTMYWDGRRIYTRSYSWLRLNGNPAPPAHVLLNLAIGGKWAGRYGIDDSAFPQSFKIDYVKVCQRVSGYLGETGDKTGYSSPPNC